MPNYSHTIIIANPNPALRLNQTQVYLAKLKLNLTHTSPNNLILDQDDTLGIEEARKIKTFLSSKAFYSGWRIVFVKYAHKLTIPAQNALLTLLEEPPIQTLFFLLVNHPHELLDTIRSRSRVLVIPHHQNMVPNSSLAPLLTQKTDYRLEWVQTFVPKLPSLQDYLHTELMFWRTKLIQTPKYELFSICHTLLYCQTLAKTALSPETVLDYLVLSIPKLATNHPELTENSIK